MRQSERSPDVERGLSFVVDCVHAGGGNVTTTQQYLFMIVHYLLIDLVSWCVLIKELENILLTERTTGVPSLPSFQTWHKSRLNMLGLILHLPK